MASISTGVGVVSGIDWGSLIDKLMAIERQPLEQLQSQVDETNAVKTALLDLNARLTALKLSASVLGDAKYFNQPTATSSNASVMAVSVTGSPAIASHSFRVDRLAHAHHVVSQGYETANASPVGGSTITVEVGDAKLEKDTPLSFLNGQLGVSLGSVRITDRSGSSAVIDLSGAVSVADVLAAVNAQADANVTASLSGNGFVITDNTGSTAHNLKVENIGGGAAATSLGIAGSVAADSLAGSSVNYVTADTSLNVLNGGLGVRTANGLNDLRILSSAGIVDVSLSSASTIQDVLDAVNGAGANNGNLTASVSSDGLSIRLVDSTGGPINVIALNGSKAALDLGLQGRNSTGGTLAGEALIPSLNSVLLRSLNGGSGVGDDVASTSLSSLNGGQGFSAGTMTIRNRQGDTADVNLAAAATIRDVVDAVNSAGISVVATVAGDHLVLQDLTGSTDYTLQVEGATAESLGIAGEAAGTILTGSQIDTIDGATTLSLLNNGNGARAVAGSDFRIWMNATTSFEVDVAAGSTVGDVLDAINNAAGNTGGDAVTASVGDDGRSIELTGASLGDHAVTVEMLNGSAAAADLGLLGDVVAHALTGRALMTDLAVDAHRERGSLVLSDRSGATGVVDLSSVETLSALVSAIGATGLDVSASVNREGNGIEITDASGGGSNLVVFSTDGTASTLGISTGVMGVSASAKNGSDLELRYLSEKTRLDEMNGGKGVAAGKIRITNRQGVSAVIDYTQEDDVLLQDVIEEINSRGIGVTARINDNGDGVLLTDSTVGAGRLKVEEVGSGTTAKDLNILGQAEVATPGVIDGSWEFSIDISAAEGLQDVADAINAADANVTASVINDGTGYSPYRLNIVSQRTGAQGAVVVDPGESTLRFSTVQRAQDAVIRYGGGDAGGSAVLLTSSTNSFDRAVEGLSLTAVSTSSTPVTVSVGRDTDYIALKMNTFVSAYNTLHQQIATYTKYDAETGERGILFGDSTAQWIERAMSDLVINPQSGLSGTVTRVKQLGVSFNTDGELDFDKEKFFDGISTNLTSVVNFFTTSDIGFAARLKTLVDGFTDPHESVLTTKNDGLNDRIDLFNERISEMSANLDRKQEDLVYQFTRMEMILGQLQQQSSALGSLSLVKSA